MMLDIILCALILVFILLSAFFSSILAAGPFTRSSIVLS